MIPASSPKPNDFFNSLLAEFESAADLENRRTPRRKLRLIADALYSAGGVRATIEDLSRNGMLLDSPVELSEGETLDIVLPRSGRQRRA